MDEGRRLVTAAVTILEKVRSGDLPIAQKILADFPPKQEQEHMG